MVLVQNICQEQDFTEYRHAECPRIRELSFFVSYLFFGMNVRRSRRNFANDIHIHLWDKESNILGRCWWRLRNNLAVITFVVWLEKSHLLLHILLCHNPDFSWVGLIDAVV